MPSSTHQVKRPYAGTHSHSNGQASITSYFSSHNNSAVSNNGSSLSSTYSHGGQNPSQRDSTSTPPLPAMVQSNLLSVGMRIRKSVPEGYKTGGGYSAFTLFADSSPGNNHGGLEAPPRPQQQARNTYGGIGYTGGKELTPFCGIMKVGGFAVQAAAAPAEDDVPFFSSQGSTISAASSSSLRSVEFVDVGLLAPSNKRRLDEDAEDDGPVWRDVASSWDAELSPKTRPLGLPGAALGERTMAMPRSRRRNGRGRVESKIGVARGLGQENADVDVDVGMDFGEAEFLDYGVLEVDMCDV